MNFHFFRLFSRMIFVSLLITGSVLYTGCTKKNEPSSSTPPSKERVVNLMIWSNYISQDLLDQFYKKTGIRVQVSNFSSNEELLAKLQAGASGYDIAVPSDYMVFAMVKLNMLRELDHQKLPRMKSLDPKSMGKKFDPLNKYSLPYDWGMTGIGINRTLYKQPIKKWRDLFEREDLAGKFSLLDDAREVVGAALKALGYSINTKNLQDVHQAKELILRARKRVRAFTSEPLMPMVNGETAVAQIYSSDALQARKKTGGKIEFVYPEEGCSIWMDNLVIPASAPHVEEAYALLDFLLEPTTSLNAATQLYLLPANRDTINLLTPEFKSDRMMFPPESALSKCEMMEDLGDFLPVIDRIWTEIKAEH